MGAVEVTVDLIRVRTVTVQARSEGPSGHEATRLRAMVVRALERL